MDANEPLNRWTAEPVHELMSSGSLPEAEPCWAPLWIDSLISPAISRPAAAATASALPQTRGRR